MPRTSNRRRLPALALLAALAVAPSITCGIDENLLTCDDAFAHVEDCCGPAFHADYSLCPGTHDGCGGPDAPKLDLATLKCIASLPCERLRQRDFCATLMLESHSNVLGDFAMSDSDAGVPDDRVPWYSCP